jgi:hypothetical protein
MGAPSFDLAKREPWIEKAHLFSILTWYAGT